ncbi:Zn-dependent exopeptidase M28 [bacterium]|nr:Zn-dependent exopeptidase M28 [bacterium]
MKTHLAVWGLLAAISLTGCRDAISLPGADPGGSAGAGSSQASTAQPCTDDAEIIDGKSALEYAACQVALGPRPAGSDALRQLAADLRKKLSAYGYKTDYQDFTAQTPNGSVSMRNVIASWPGSQPGEYLVGAHYDTKLLPDCAFVGANDGASGVAVDVEMARMLAKKPLRHGLKFVFFDGEEAVRRWNPQDSLYGSRYYAQEAAKNGLARSIKAVFILDMVGDAKLQVTDDYFSSSELKNALNAAARDLNLTAYFPGSRFTAIEDDHLPFIQLGIPAVDVTGFGSFEGGVSPAYWHTAGDTMDKLSADSLSAVGSAVLLALRRLDSAKN